MKALVVVAAALGVLGLAGCLQAWPLQGSYRCSAGNVCPAGFQCDDGLCCKPNEAPLCRTLVLDGGTCADGSTPKTYWVDADNDSYGDVNGERSFCAKPVETLVAERGQDCDDTRPDVFPGSSEVCNGRDDDCDGVIDEGLPGLRTFFRDEDGDGYGNPDAGVKACARPPGTVDTADDCDDRSTLRRPLAPEQCNGLDDNCNGGIDESPVLGTGLACDTGKKGLCAPGLSQCQMAKKTCVGPAPAALDVCDGLDNDCDGLVDERPDCGGPASFIGDKQFAFVQGLPGTIPFPDQTSRCLKDYPGATAATAWAPPVWNGANNNYQLFFMEAPAGKVWDLTKPDAVLKLAMSWTSTMAGDPWSGANYPVVYFCSETPGVFLRLVRPPGLLKNQTGNFSSELTLNLSRGDTGWLYGLVMNPPDVRRIKRVEVLAKVATGTFAITWSPDAGFGP